MQPSVETLFARWREHREPRDLAAVFDRCATELWRVGYHLTGSRNEADDLLQATFLAAMQSAAHWRAEQALEPWLAGILANKLRMQRRRARLAVPAAFRPDPAEDPVALAERAELRSALQQRIAQLDEPYRAVLVLQLDHGLTPAEIAHALGRPRATVRSQLQRGLELLRRGLPLGLFGAAARGMVVPQLAAVRAAVVAAAGGGGVAAGTLIGAGAVVMAKKLLVACLVVLVAGASLWWAWPAATQEPGLLGADGTAPFAAAVVGPATRPSNEDVPANRSAAPLATPLAAATTGDLRVVVRWADATAAAGMGVSLEPPNHAGGFLAQVWQNTDAGGVAMFRELAPGPVTVAARQGGDIDVEVQAGRVVDCELTIPEGVDVRGLVVGPDGIPVPHATIAMGPMTVGVTSDRLVAVSQADGNGGFFLRSVPAQACIAAFAASNAPSVAVTVAELLAKQPVQLQVGGPRRSLRGRVVDGQGAPIEGAWVAEGLLAFRAGQPGVQIVRTDAAGNFELLGALGSNWCQLHAGALQCGTWHHMLSEAEQASQQPLVIRLERGASIRGTVKSIDGSLVPDAVIRRVIDTATPESGMADQRPRWCTAHWAIYPDGRYCVDRLAPGLVQLALVDRADARVAYREFTVQPGEELVWDAVLVERPAFRGRLVDADGGALVGWRVRADGPAFEPMPQSDPSDAEGRFTVPKCAPAPYTLLVYAPEGAWNPPVSAVEAVVPGGEELLVRVPRVAVPSCRVRGTVTAKGAVGEVRLLLVRATGSAAVASIVSGASFALGPVPAGPYSLLVEVPLGDRTTVSQVLGTWDLEPGQEIDVGTVTLPEPTDLVFELVDASGRPVPRAQLALLHRAVSFHGGTLLNVIDGRATAKVLPGTYGVASYLGKECIEQPEFEIRSERKVVPLRLSTGVLRHFRIDVPQSRLENVGHIVLVRQGVEVLRSVLLFAAKGPTEWSRTLSPGPWEMAITLANGRTERFPFVVTADADAPPIEIRMAR